MQLKLIRWSLVIAALMIFAGCRKPATQTTITYPNAVITSETENDKSKSVVSQNPSIDNSGRKFSASMALNNGTVKIEYQFAGTAFCQVDPVKNIQKNVDIYVFQIIQPNQPAEVVPFIYKGGSQVVWDRSNIRVMIEQQ